ncbi:MAG: FAD-binding protein [Candidatus Chaera renei]|uniref:D-lactate dehydrogenase (cytochrome) n=1 Tax=Candidatus Chaera renei TaxID=2506947 RepID=A0A4Q0AJR6_9BACT|nr:MAG: FAD-binding protein [Candidatus Chaera renei]
MNKIARFLQEHLDGEVFASAAVREYFSTDASVLKIPPQMVVYPAGKNDVRKVARFCWQLAEKGRLLPITPRGRGTDQAGAAIGSGVVMAFPAHMNKLLEIDTKQRMVRLQPGANFGAVQDTLQTHGFYLPPYPASLNYSTIGGAIANNCAGERSLKYGPIADWVDQLEVVLANGEIIYTERVSKRELNRRKGLSTMEGEIYRQVDGLITDNWDLLKKYADSRQVSKNSSGYNLTAVKQSDGSFDLTPLFVGSQGTLGVVTEAILRFAPYTPQSELLVAEFASLEAAGQAVEELLKLKPCSLEMVDRRLLEFVQKHQPDLLKDLVGEDGAMPEVVLLAEFDNPSHKRSKLAKKAAKAIEGKVKRLRRSDEFYEQQRFWAIRHSAASVVNFNDSGRAALPIIEDGVVPRRALVEYIEKVYQLLDKHHLEAAVWGHAGDANLHLQPLLDLSKIAERQKAFKLMQEYYSMVIALGGSVTAEHGDGRLRSPYLVKQHGLDVVELFSQLKKIFDPYGTLNPGVKLHTDVADLVPLLRQDYSLRHLADHLPRT